MSKKKVIEIDENIHKLIKIHATENNSNMKKFVACIVQDFLRQDKEIKKLAHGLVNEGQKDIVIISNQRSKKNNEKV